MHHIKMSNALIVIGVGTICAVAICTGFMYASRIGMRHDLMRQCGVGMDCECFANIIRNRMSVRDMRIFSDFMTAVRTRPSANILEFTDETSATRIFANVSLCRVKTESESTINNTQQKAKK